MRGRMVVAGRVVVTAGRFRVVVRLVQFVRVMALARQEAG